MSEDIDGNRIKAYPQIPIITRAAPVRLGKTKDGEVIGPRLYYPTNHGSVGIISVSYESGTEPTLKVNTDFDNANELVIHASAAVDLQLAQKGIMAGVSGGGSVSRIRIFGTRPVPNRWWDSTSPTYAAGTALHPGGSWANPDCDNLWIVFHSILKSNITPDMNF